MQMEKGFEMDHVAYWEHYKGGRYVLVENSLVWFEEDMDKDVDDNEKRLVIYKSLETGEVFARRRNVFFENVMVDGLSVPRFRSVSWREALIVERERQ